MLTTGSITVHVGPALSALAHEHATSNALSLGLADRTVSELTPWGIINKPFACNASDLACFASIRVILMEILVVAVVVAFRLRTLKLLFAEVSH